jgi:hypothetical protein
MQVSDCIQPKQIIAHPDCPTCGAPMFLMRIEPAKPDYDKRTFECPQCLEQVTEVVKFR